MQVCERDARCDIPQYWVRQKCGLFGSRILDSTQMETTTCPTADPVQHLHPALARRGTVPALERARIRFPRGRNGGKETSGAGVAAGPHCQRFVPPLRFLRPKSRLFGKSLETRNLFRKRNQVFRVLERCCILVAKHRAPWLVSIPTCGPHSPEIFEIQRPAT